MLTDTWLKNELSLKPVLSLQIKKTHGDLWAILLMKGIEELLFWIKINQFSLLTALGRSGLCKCRAGLFYLCFLSKTYRCDFVTRLISLQYSDFYSQIDGADRELFWNNLFFNIYSGEFVRTDKFLQCHQEKQTWTDRVHAEDFLLPLKIIPWELTFIKTTTNTHVSIMLRMLH